MFTKVEEPDYTVLESREDHAKIREFRPQILAAKKNASLCAEMR
ncbi:MAG: hypothetical protein NTX42_01885 [Methanothrix sp.]|nr:hypothetical protein [Methanothrix sp.]